MAIAYYNPETHDLEIENAILKEQLRKKQLEDENKRLKYMLRDGDSAGISKHW